MSLTTEQINDYARQVYESKVPIVEIHFADLSEEAKEDYRRQALQLFEQGAWG